MGKLPSEQRRERSSWIFGLQNEFLWSEKDHLHLLLLKIVLLSKQKDNTSTLEDKH